MKRGLIRHHELFDRRGGPGTRTQKAEAQPEDAQHGAGSREQLLRMDFRFCPAVSREERPQIGPPRRAGAA
jgi:hypothetical protein